MVTSAPSIAPLIAQATAPTATAAPAPKTTHQRDTAVDAARAILLVIVVALHAFMVGVSRDGAGTPVLENAMELWAGWTPLTFVVQIMPLFFALGGFAAYTQYTRLQARGTTATQYIASRLVRLLVPASAAIAAIAVFLSALTIAQVPAAEVAAAGFRISQPMWFLAVYLCVSALVPIMVKLHQRHRVATFIALLLGALAVDIVRASTGVAAVGILNLVFVWLCAQQLGFALADGSITRLTARARLGIATTAAGALIIGISSGLYIANQFGALFPPMGSLILLGIIQVMLFETARASIGRLSRNTTVQRIVGWINARAMTIYSWHMLVTIAIAGSLLLSPFALPAPITVDWWLSRPIWFLAVGLAVFAVTSFTGRWEMRRISPQTTSRIAVIPALLVSIAGVVLVLANGHVTAAWVIAAASVALSLTLVLVPRSKSFAQKP